MYNTHCRMTQGFQKSRREIWRRLLFFPHGQHQLSSTATHLRVVNDGKERRATPKKIYSAYCFSKIENNDRLNGFRIQIDPSKHHHCQNTPYYY